MAPDLAPLFPLPGRGDRVLVSVHGRAPGGARWCRVIDADTGPDVLFPVVVRLPDGRRGAYQQHEITGWKPSRLRVIWGRLAGA